MPQVKLTIARGGNRLQDVTQSAGTAITGSDAMELNIDVTAMRKGDALMMLDKLKQKIAALKWPLV